MIRELRITFEPARVEHLHSSRLELSRPRDAATLISSLLANEAQEVLGVLCLTQRHRLICWHVVSRGSLTTCMAPACQVFRAAFLVSACGLILAHNHPSGDPAPSPDDISLTTKLSSAGQIVGVPVIDHIVVGDSNYFSFREAGLMPSAVEVL